MYAIVDAGGKQYRVSPGEIVKVAKLSSTEGSEVVLDKVLFIKKENEQMVGDPYVNGAKFVASVEGEGKTKKVIIFKQKTRKNYRRFRGQRQHYTALRIKEIVAGG